MRQLALKPQDLVVLVKLAAQREREFTYVSLAQELALSASETHASLKRAHAARLISSMEPKSSAVIRTALIEFAVHGVKYSFPAITGAISRGVATSFAGPSLRSQITQSEELVYVWPKQDGDSRGPSLAPLYPSVPTIALIDQDFYDLLTLVDAIRSGAARERTIAGNIFTSRIA